MLDNNQFRTLIVNPTLSALDMYSKQAEELMVFTCATESEGGRYLHQVDGPALGIYQMEPATYHDIWERYLKVRPQVLIKMFNLFDIDQMPKEERLIYDLKFATAMTRLYYKRIKEQLPNPNPESIWEYYKKYYNTPQGKAEKLNSLKMYRLFSYY